MSSPDAPPAPDYVGAAREQGAANLAAARLNAQLGRVNYVTPYGSLTYSNGGSGGGSGAPSGTTGGNALPGTGYRQGQFPSVGGGFGFGGGAGGFGNFGFGNGAQPSDQYTATIKLDPSQQRLLDAQNQQSLGLANLANGGISRVGQAMGQDYTTSSLPALRGGSTGPDYQYSVDNPQVQSRIDTSGVSGMPGDLSALQQKATDAAMSRQNLQLDQQEGSLKNQLANQGITPGSEAYNRALQPLNQQRVDAQNQAFLTGTNYENQLFNQGLAQNNQGFNQALASGQFGNSAAAQQFAQGLSSGQFGNDARSQAFQNQLQGSALSNAARGQGIQEQAFLRSQPLNELNALRSGSQVTMPSFGMGGGGAGAGGVQPGNFQNAAAQQGQWNQAMYGADVGAYNSQLGGAAALGSAAIMAAIM